MKQIHRTNRKKTIFVAVAALAMVAVATGVMASNLSASYDEVIDADKAVEYAQEQIPQFLVAATEGTIEVRQVLGHDIQVMERAMFGVDPKQAPSPELVWVISFHAQEGAFVAPRPRHGFDSTLSGDTLLVMMDPKTGYESRAVLFWEDVPSSIATSRVLVAKQGTVVPFESP